MKAYSLDLRERIVTARRNGESVESVAQRFAVCTKTVRTYEKRAAQGRLSRTLQTGKDRRLSPEQHEELRTLVLERSDWTLASLGQAWQERTQQELPSSTLHDALNRLDMTYKKRVASLKNAAEKNAPPLPKP
jgi:transposase